MSIASRRARAFLQLVDVMTRLRGPGGCPWDAEQTPQSLMPYMLEETHEAMEAIAGGDTAEICEELGDMLLQVVFQAELFREAGSFDIADVCDSISAKLIRRHPHVFADATWKHREELLASWDRIKRGEKPTKAARTLDEDVPRTLPALARAQALLAKARRRQLPPPPAVEAQHLPKATSPDAAGALLLALCQQAEQEGWDLEQALTAAMRSWLQKAAPETPSRDTDG